jgi:hypothetical protein
VKPILHTEHLGILPAGNNAGRDYDAKAEAANRHDAILKGEARSRQEVSAIFSNAAPNYGTGA